MITIFDLNAAVLQTRRNPNISICSFIISTLDRSSLEKSATYYLLGIDCLKTGLFDDKPNFKGIPIYYSKEIEGGGSKIFLSLETEI